MPIILTPYSAPAGPTVPAATIEWDFINDESLTDTSATHTLSYQRVAQAGNTNSYAIDATGDLVFVDASTPRFDHDPVTLANRGLLMEGGYSLAGVAGAYNAVNFSYNVSSNVWWAETSLSWQANQPGSPAGDSTAYFTFPTAVTGAHKNNSSLMNVSGVSVGGGVCYSMFLKHKPGSTYSHVRFECIAGTATFNMMCDAEFGTITDTSGTAVATGVVDAGNGWYRFWAIVDTVSTVNVRFNHWISPGANLGDELSFLGAGTSSHGVWTWGAQVNRDRYLHSHKITNTGDSESDGDQADIATGGWFNHLAGTLYVELEYPESSENDSCYPMGLGDGNGTDLITMLMRSDIGLNTRVLCPSHKIRLAYTE
jgi:hypothetical protein